MNQLGLYCLVVLLAGYNLVMLWLLRRVTGKLAEVPYSAVKRIINFQICADLIILTILLHFSGGVENPFVFYFVFHIIIASILLSVRESYLQATFAVVLFGLLVLLEYNGIIYHYCLEGFAPDCVVHDGFYALGTFFVFTTVLYLVVYIASYIAERLRHAEQSQKQANDFLLEKDRIKDEYVLRVTHDIKGHLAAIQSCIGVVSSQMVGPLVGKQAEFVNRAHERTKKLTVFVRTLLRLTQMRLSDTIEKESFSLSETVRNAVAGASARAESKNISLSCHVDPSVQEVFGNQFSIEESISNLIFNAVKYTPENGRVDVEVSGGDGTVEVKVSDSGIGIPGEELPRVFDEFFRASNARKVERDGTGLGLSIVKYIVERHGGQIDVENNEGCGTTFRLTLPIKQWVQEVVSSH
jgi:signal transduction histidine kinase